MPSADLEILESNRGNVPSAGNVMAIFGCCSDGEDYVVKAFDSDTGVQAVLGDGPLTEYVVPTSRVSKKRVLAIPVPATIDGTVSAVTEAPAGSGPTITVAGDPLDRLEVVVKITKAGANAVGKYRIALDYGETYGPELEIPAKSNATLVGSVDLTGVTLSTLNTTTLKVTASVGGLQTITFTTPSSIADIATQANAGSTGMTFSIANNRLKVIDDVTGSTSSLAIDATSTADTILGLSGTTTGAEATYAIPGTGLTVTFPSGTYVLDTTYSFSTTAPKFSLTDLDTAIDALKNSGVAFGMCIIAQESLADAAEVRALADSVSAKLSSLLSQKKPTRVLIPSLLATTVTAAGWETVDQAVKAEFATFFDSRVVRVDGDAIVTGGAHKGKFRRSALINAAKRAAKARFSSDLGNGQDGPLEETHSVTRDEYSATTKMRDFRGTVIETRPESTGFYFARGVTMANPASTYADLNICRVVDEACKILQPLLNAEVNNDRVLAVDGTIDETEAQTLDRKWTKSLRQGLVTPSGSEPHVSRARAAVSRTEVIGDTEHLIADFELQKKGQQKSVTGRLGVVAAFEETS